MKSFDPMTFQILYGLAGYSDEEAYSQLVLARPRTHRRTTRPGVTFEDLIETEESQTIFIQTEEELRRLRRARGLACFSTSGIAQVCLSRLQRTSHGS